MGMNAEIRQEKLEEVKSQTKPCGLKRMRYKNDNVTMEAYDIPVEYLIFNQYNGRIGTFVKTHEKQHGPIDATTPEGEKLVLQFLWKSKENRNKTTLEDIKEKGQQEIGIVTKDGVIIDGNRRCMLLKEIAQEPTYFRAVILDDRLEDNPKEIRKLETTYQMGVDQPVDYNPIEKYLACKDLHNNDGFTYKQIANMMGEKPADIKRYLEILKLMEYYLDAHGYTGMYTRLGEESVEGPFVNLNAYLVKHSGTGVQGRDWTPNKDDIDDLKNITFDYIRAGIRTAHGIRDIGNPLKGKGFFSNKEIWKNFSKRYADEVEPINESEESLENWKKNRPNEDIEGIIQAREEDWKKKVEKKIKENLGKTKRELDDINEANSPMELLQRAEKTIYSINTENEAFLFDKDVLTKIKEINKTLWGFQQTIKHNKK